MIVSAAFNITCDGSVILDGEHSPGTSAMDWESLGINCLRKSTGKYYIYGPSISWMNGWRVSVFKDENDMPTVFVKLSSGDGYVYVETYDPENSELPKDIESLMTIRVGVDVNVDRE